MAIFRDRPNAQADNFLSGAGSRAGRYGEQYVLAPDAGKMSSFADEGSYFSVLNTTPGTGIAGHAAPTSADATKPFLWIFNGGQNRLYLDFINIRMTAIGAGATTAEFSVFLDTGATRASGGTQVTPRNVNSDSVAASAATVYMGPTVLVNSAAVHVAHHRLRSVVSVVEDQYNLSFGNPGYGYSGAVTTTGTAIVNAYASLPPIVVGPGDSFIFVQWSGSQSGAHSMDLEVGYWER
jgi:hypothetical protein